MADSPSGKKPFNELSDVAKFHLAPKLFGEDAQYPFFESEIQEIRYAVETNALKESEGREDFSTPEGRHMRDVIQEALKVKLMDSAKGDPAERKKLELCKNRIRQYVANVLESIKTYIGAILDLEEAAKRGYKIEIANADDKRRLSHNALIENVNILNRSLLWWFGTFDPNSLSEEHLAMYEKQENTFISQGIQRVEIPANGICPLNFNISDRKEITRWAKAIYKDLISIRRLSGPVD